MSERNEAELGGGLGNGAWEEYLSAARALDAVRRSAAAAAGEQAQAVQAARDELTKVRTRLAPQQSRLRELGVPEARLVASPAEVAAAAQRMAAGPESVLAALRQARATADAADAVLVAGGPVRPPMGLRPAAAGGGRPWLRNLLVYGPYALAVLVVQFVLYLAVDSFSLPALLCGLGMPAAAFGLGWLTVGLAFPAGPGGRVDRTSVLGVVVCVAAPMVLSCVGVAALRLLG